MKNTRYYIINIVVLFVTVILFASIIVQNFIWFCTKADVIPIFFLTLLCIVAIHFVKALRLYFIMLETRLTLDCFFRVYIKTTLVNLIFPFKLGEFFRMYCFGNELKSNKKGILLILIDRYFDTIPLVLILLTFTLSGGNSLSGVVIILIAFLIVVTIMYTIFPSTFKYLNRFFIVNTTSDRGIIALELLKKTQFWYSYMQELIEGRERILLILSGLVWLMEYGSLYCLISGVGDVFSLTDFVVYMNSVFMGSGSEYIIFYVGISAVVLAGVSVVVYGRHFVMRKRNQI